MVNTISKELAQHVINGGFIHCRDIHDHSCAWNTILKFLTVMKIAFKFYLPIHGIPMLFRRKKLVEKPVECMKILLKNLLQSCLFMASYVAIFRYLQCFLKNSRGKIDRWNVMIPGFLCSFGILFEPQSRRSELSLYLIPRFLEAVWMFLEKRGLVRFVPHWDIIVFCFAMGILMYCYQNEQKAIKPTYLSMFKSFWGEN